MIERKKTKLNIFELIVIFMFLFLFQISSDSYFTLFLSIALIIYSVISNEYKDMLILMLLTPQAENLIVISTITLPIIIICALFLKTFVIKIIVEKKINVSKWFLLSIILLLYSVVNIKIIDNYVQLITTIKFILIMSFISRFYNYCKQNNLQYIDVFSSMVRYLGLGLIFAGLCTIFISGGLNGIGRFSFGGSSTINVIGIQCAVDIVGIVYLFLIKKNKLLDLGILFGDIIIVILTMSRTAVLMSAIAIVLFVITLLIRGGNIRLILLTFLLIILGGFFFSNQTINTYIDNLSRRFEAQDVSNGRYFLWEQTIDKMMANKKYFTIGAGDYNKIGAVYGKNNSVLVAHNFLIETWVIYGTIGSFILLLIFALFIKEVLIINKETKYFRFDNWYSFVPILTYSAGLLYSHQILGGPNLIIYIFCIIPILTKNEKMEEHNAIKKSHI